MFEGRSVVELGAGAGLVSIVLALLGAKTVALTDGDPEACDAARESTVRNGVDGCVQVSRFRWGCGAESESEIAEVLRRGGNGRRCAHTLVATDVLYDPEMMDSLEAALRDLLQRGGCRYVILGCRRTPTLGAATAHVHVTPRTPVR